jgi:hypothetical protein
MVFNGGGWIQMTLQKKSQKDPVTSFGREEHEVRVWIWDTWEKKTSGRNVRSQGEELMEDVVSGGGDSRMPNSKFAII